ncbi:FAD-dependent oxidoreductase [Sinomonas sp. ASV486]|uniref:FAD-dependent oxidoreductase n=1 Tax=Sinomonas sp. ASV486 TaxID=3051170 RepID=UPI0027DBC207|nr:FAD-dependent oxidoreductase [Sinomonas sp. ASV486]MDQ4489784.1 FAD-dependent oxidoreductase [Sinomonas sp. ASV486]
MTPQGKSLHLPGAHVPVRRNADVAVIGGGPSGVCAAVAAARAGASVLLLEDAGFLGGTATGGMVASWNAFYWRDIRVTGGTAYEITQRLEAAGGGAGFENYVAAELTDNPVPFETFPFDPEILKLVLDELVREAGIEVIYHAHATDVIASDGTVEGIVYEGPVRRAAIRAERFVDATGHGTIALKAGAAQLNSGARLQPMTLMIRVSGIRRSELEATPRDTRRSIVQAGIERGDLFYRTLAVSYSPANGDAFLLMSTVDGADGTDEFSLTTAEQEGRRQIRSTLEYLRANMPGFSLATLVQIAPWIGVRETRRVWGDYVLTGHDVRTGAEFDDAISWGGGPVDIHEGHTVRLANPERPFAVPYRSLLPRGVENVLIAGRALSADAEAMGGLRHMGGIMPTGDAAGAAAALSAARDITPRDLPADALRDHLRNFGAIVDDPLNAHARAAAAGPTAGGLR